MKRYIENLRQKSEAEKSQVAFWGAFVITGFIALFWLAGVTYSNERGQKSQVANPAGPIENIGRQFGDAYSDLLGKLDN